MKSGSRENWVNVDESLTEQCTGAILEQIRSGILRPSQRLGEVKIARRLKMGRAPVRAAFDRLASVGLLERIPRSGTFVRKVSLDEYCELLDVRAALESMAARLACPRMSESDLERLTIVATRLDHLGAQVDARKVPPKPTSREYKELQELENAFHGGIAKASGNRRIVDILSMQHLVEHCFNMGMSMPVTSLELMMTVPTHLSVAKAFKSRDPEIAAKAVIDHYLATKQVAVARLTGQGSPGSPSAVKKARRR